VMYQDGALHRHFRQHDPVRASKFDARIRCATRSPNTRSIRWTFISARPAVLFVYFHVGANARFALFTKKASAHTSLACKSIGRITGVVTLAAMGIAGIRIDTVSATHHTSAVARSSNTRLVRWAYFTASTAVLVISVYIHALTSALPQ